VLAGVDEHGVGAPCVEGVEHRLDLHVVGPGPGHADHAHRDDATGARRQTVPAVARLFLSPPDVGDDERALLLDAFDSGWIAPLGPHVDAFEREFAEAVGVRHAVALSSGTAALHLALVLLGVGEGDEVLVPTLTFVATANAVRYVGATPVFVDSERASWCIDPELVASAVRDRRPKAVIAVDLYGQCADYDRLRGVCNEHGVPIVEDAAEALGATYRGRPAGGHGSMGVFSFNGNKIVTTSGGGMLVADDEDVVARARFLSMQAREPTRHYEHGELGFNYRMSNLLAAVGRGQIRRLAEKVERRRAVHERYRHGLGGLPGLSFMPEAPYGRATRWLTVALVDPEAFGADRNDIVDHLEKADIEARPAWKPMHRQRLYADAPVVGGAVADDVFERGVCLPSGSAMSDGDVDRVVAVVHSTRRMA
jgi:dTDP-4-amino-4,6-dideoxygalactose transaminase